MVFDKFHMKQKKKILMSPLNSNKLFFSFLIFQQFWTSQNNITICPQLKFIKFKQIFSFSFVTIYALLFFIKNVHFLKRFLMLCSTGFKFLFFFSFFFYFFCLFPLFCRPFLKKCFFINKLLIHYFLNLISASLCLYLNIITIGSLIKLFQWYFFFFQQVSLQKHGSYPAIISSFLLVPNTTTQY